jgi:hypothetical protein
MEDDHGVVHVVFRWRPPWNEKQYALLHVTDPLPDWPGIELVRMDEPRLLPPAPLIPAASVKSVTGWGRDLGELDIAPGNGESEQLIVWEARRANTSVERVINALGAVYATWGSLVLDAPGVPGSQKWPRLARHPEQKAGGRSAVRHLAYVEETDVRPFVNWCWVGFGWHDQGHIAPELLADQHYPDVAASANNVHVAFLAFASQSWSLYYAWRGFRLTPTPTPRPTWTPTPSPTPSPLPGTPTNTPAPTATPTPTCRPRPTPSPTDTPFWTTIQAVGLPGIEEVPPAISVAETSSGGVLRDEAHIAYVKDGDVWHCRVHTDGSRDNERVEQSLDLGARGLSMVSWKRPQGKLTHYIFYARETADPPGWDIFGSRAVTPTPAPLSTSTPLPTPTP